VYIPSSTFNPDGLNVLFDEPRLFQKLAHIRVTTNCILSGDFTALFYLVDDLRRVLVLLAHCTILCIVDSTPFGSRISLSRRLSTSCYLVLIQSLAGFDDTRFCFWWVWAFRSIGLRCDRLRSLLFGFILLVSRARHNVLYAQNPCDGLKIGEWGCRKSEGRLGAQWPWEVIPRVMM